LVVVTDPNYSDSAVSRLMTNIVAAASEFQQDLTRERMADMRAALKRQGKRVAGRVPFGYQADPDTKKLIIDPEPAIIVRDFFELASKGARPSELANLANLSDWKDQNGESGKWTARRIPTVFHPAIPVRPLPACPTTPSCIPAVGAKTGTSPPASSTTGHRVMKTSKIDRRSNLNRVKPASCWLCS
jgi:hypothetical protein